MQEITLIEMLDGSEEEENIKHIEETHVMSSSVIRNFINEPSQRLLYEYDFLNLKTFYIELLSVYKQKEDVKYPRVTNKRGEIIEPVQPEGIMDDEELRNQLLQDFEDLMDYDLDNPTEYL